jgi:hypothetical protein
MGHVFAAMGAGASAGAILLFLSHIAPKFGAGNFVRDLDKPILLGRSVTRREAHFVGMFLHLVMSAVFGAGYAVLADHGLVSGFDPLPIFAWGLGLACVNGLVVFPIEGHGIFGIKEDSWFPVDLVITNLLWAALFWWLMRLWLGLAISS